VKKELFPIVDRDGLAKPAILLIIDEALEAGIEEVILVVRAQDVGTIQAFFASEPAPELWAALPDPQKRMAQRIREANRHLTLAIQMSQDGLGHAVYSARKAVSGEPFLLMLGDHVYRSSNARPCAHQLLTAYERHGRNVLGLRRVREEELAHYGVVGGSWLEPDRLLRISGFSEKPLPNEARANLRVPGLPESEYLAVFGQYILRPTLFEHLEAQISDGIRQRGEFQLTSALEALREDEGFLGLVMEGQAYDIGMPASYLETLIHFGIEA
jgi:UTP--glucose-1-phosphate uridylyltransferase